MRLPNGTRLQSRARTRLTLVAALVAGWVVSFCAMAASIAATGSWSPTIGQSNACTPSGCLPGCADSCAAGNDLQSTYESGADIVTLDVDVDVEGVTYEVQVRRDNSWAGTRQTRDWAISVGARRTTGSGDCTTCAGGTEYQTVTTSYAALFTLTADGSDIPIQIELTGFGIYCPIQAYATLLSFRLVRVSDGALLATAGDCSVNATVERILYFSPGAAPGNQTTLTISSAVAGSPPATVYTSDAKYKITTNGTASDASQKITGSITSALPAGVTLAIRLTPPPGGAYQASGGSYVVMSNTQAHDLVLGIESTAEKGLTVACRLEATAAAGVVALGSTDLTLTIVVT